MIHRFQVNLAATSVGTSIETRCAGLGAARTILSFFEHACHAKVIRRHVGRRGDEGGPGDEEGEGDFEGVEVQHCERRVLLERLEFYDGILSILV